MKLFREMLLILLIFFIGDFISKALHLPVPGNIIGMLLLLALLLSKVIKLSHIETVSNFFLDHLSFFFIPAGVGLLTSIDVLRNSWGRILLVCVISTIIMIAVTGFVIELVTKLLKTN